MNTLIEALKKHLKENQKKYVVHSDWNGCTETGFYETDDFDMDRLLEEIDKFAASFKEST